MFIQKTTTIDNRIHGSVVYVDLFLQRRSDSFSIYQTAKHLGISPRALHDYLRDNGFIFWNGEEWSAYQGMINECVLDQVPVVYSSGTYSQVRVTNKGMALLKEAVLNLRTAS